MKEQPVAEAQAPNTSNTETATAVETGSPFAEPDTNQVDDRLLAMLDSPRDGKSFPNEDPSTTDENRFTRSFPTDGEKIRPSNISEETTVADTTTAHPAFRAFGSEPSTVDEDLKVSNPTTESANPFRPETSEPQNVESTSPTIVEHRSSPLFPTPDSFSAPKGATEQRSTRADPASGATVPISRDEQEQIGVSHIMKPSKIQQVAAVRDECEICEVQLKDNYWSISKRMYGTSRYFSALALYNQNRIPDPRKLRPGMKVLVPDPKALEAKYPELFRSFQPKAHLPTGYFLLNTGSPAYRVGDRETLSEISQKHLGRASRWIQIYRMNQQNLSDPNRLKPGTILLLPDDATNVQVAP